MVIISWCVSISKHHFVYLIFLFVEYILNKADGAEGVDKNYADCDLDNNIADELFINTTCSL